MNRVDDSPASFWGTAFNKRTLICVFTGFASGLPLYILFQLVPAWMRSEGVGLKEIGLFSLISLPYTWKFLWAPLLERYLVPLFGRVFGRRRGWMLTTQIVLLLLISALGFLDLDAQLGAIVALCALIAAFSATQDIVLDAYRRELLPDAELGFGNSVHVNAYRIAGLVPGSLSLILADLLPWALVFPITAGFLLVGVALTFSIDEINMNPAPSTLRAAVLEPFNEFVRRDGLASALLVLLFMFLYKLGDNMATALSTPFYLDLGFTMTEIGVIAKNAALWPAILGSILGGLWMIRLGINRALWIFGGVQVVSILGFAFLAQVGPDKLFLGLVIGFEYLGVGLGTAAFIAYIARNVSLLHTATQFALLTALASLPRAVANATTGFIVEVVGWHSFFLICALLALPGMLLLLKVAPWSKD